MSAHQILLETKSRLRSLDLSATDFLAALDAIKDLEKQSILDRTIGDSDHIEKECNVILTDYGQAQQDR